MKKYYTFFQHPFVFFFLVFLSLNLLSAVTFAQQPAGVEEGMLRIKVSEELAAQIEAARMTRTSDNILMTGITSLDNVSVQFKVSALKRVFRHGGKFENKHRRYGLHRWYEIQMDKATPVLAALSAYGKIDQVEIAEPVYKKAIVGSENSNFGPVVFDLKDAAPYATLPGASNDPLLPNQWHYNNTSQTGGTTGSDIKLFQAWGIETGSSDVIVAVTDGGIQVDHPDLVANMWVNVNEIPGNGIDDDNNGYVDDVNGYGFGDDTGEIAPDDHGTHVGGTVAATTNNGVGVAGVAGGSGVGDGVRLMSCAAFGGTSNGGFAETYVYGADMGAVISQNSWGYTIAGAFEQAVLDGIDYFIAEAGRDEFGNQVGPMNGGIVLVAAGNSNSNNLWYPGYYAPTVAVAGTTHNDTKAWYSNFGEWVDISAPGGETNNVAQQGVLSTFANNQYGFFQGTSMACPHASGLAALIISRYGGPGLTPDMVRARLEETTDDIDHLNPTYAGLLGTGRINAFNALQQDDDTPPEAIDDLAVSDVTITGITVTWTSPVDAGNGSASFYDIRYSTLPIDDDNFADATAVLNPPAPQPAGSTESVVLSGLLPGTTYYIAIKSADFFGNTSGLSNVVEQSTNFPPVVSVSPASLSESLVTAETSIQVVTIANTGQGPLDFELNTTGTPSFATPSPLNGTVPEGESADITIQFDANGLFEGTYGQVLVISTNDPVTPTVEVPLTLSVTNNNAPIATVKPDTVDFGGVFEGGSVTRFVTLHNAGSDTLKVSSIVSDSPLFTSDFSGELRVDPFSEAVITLTFSPQSIGEQYSFFTISTNDPANSQLIVAVSGAGLEAPGIVVSPDAFSVSLNTDRTTTEVMTIQNTGGSDLEIAIDVEAGETISITTTKQLNLSSGAVSMSTAVKASPSPTFKSPSSIALKSVEQSSAVASVLILSPDNNVTDLASILNGFADVEADIFPKASLPAISLSDLEGYDVVMTTNNTQWLGSGSVDPVVIGDLLADYIDQGGKVIVNQFAYSYDAWKMDGRFITGQYGPFIPSTTDANISTSLGTILESGHPVMDGVSSLLYSGFVQNVGLAPGATALADWANGELFMAVNSNVVALNMLPSLGDGNSLQWSGDLPTIYQNAIHWLSGPGFISASPSSAIIAPGVTADIELTFDATGLDAGTYPASININSNVPGQELISVPAELVVLGPEFVVAPTSLSEVLEKGETSTQLLTITNNGAESRSFAVSVQNAGPISVSTRTVQQEAAQVVSSSKGSPVARKSSGARQSVNLNGKEAIIGDAAPVSRSGARIAQSAVPLYSTNFENFLTGDINGQNGWAGQYGNWEVDTLNPAGGLKHFRGLADGLGQSLAFSPLVAIGSDSLSTTSMRIDVTGTGVTWQIIPQSPTAGLVCTRIQFSPDGSAQALVDDGAGGAMLLPIATPVPSGYFTLAIEMHRATGIFTVLFNGSVVFSGQGFAGDIEQLVVLSLMEVAGPTLDIDNFQLLDGEAEVIDPFISVSPVDGVIAAGESIQIMVNFDAGDLEFGQYGADIVIDFDVEQLTVPATLAVVGDPVIEVDPRLLQVEVPYKGDTVRHFTIKNTGGNPLDYNLQVLGAGTSQADILNTSVAKAAKKPDSRVAAKLAEDNRLSRPLTDVRPTSMEILTGTSLLEEHFEGGAFPPSGWSVVDNEGTGLVWSFAANHGAGNYCGTGEAATVNSDFAGSVEFDTELQTPVINVSGYKNVVVQYNASYQNYANFDFLDLDIMVEGSSSWTTVLSWNEDHGTFEGTPGEFVSVELDDYLAGATSFKLRWHYYDPNTGDWDWYAQIDDVVVLGDPRAWLSVSPVAGTVPVGESIDITTYFDAEDVDPGFYVAAVLVNSNATNEPLIGVFGTMTVLDPAVIEVRPDSIYQELMEGESASQEVVITNTGVSPLEFAFESITIQGATGEAKERIQTGKMRTAASTPTIARNSTAAILSEDIKRSASVELYATGFEEFTTGDINGQEGWAGQYGNWTVEADNPFNGAQHFRGLSDGLGQSLAFSPEVSIGTDSISSTTMKINVQGSGVTWQIIPQSTTASLVNTRFEISADGSASALIDDGAGGAIYDPIPAAVPSGYFDLRIDVIRSASIFTIYFNNEPVYSGQGFAGDIEQVVVLSLMETSGPTFDVDNLAILDGEPQAPWLQVNPKAGVIPSGGQLSVTVLMDAQDLEKGIYENALNIASNDPVTPFVTIPVTLKVDRNVPPVIAAVSDTSVVETGFMTLHFTATDEDDSLVNVTLINPPSFVIATNQGNGLASYSVAPKINDRGDYHLTVVAEDGRGAIDSASFTLSVLPYGVQNFSLLNAFTGEELEVFADSVAIDVSDPSFFGYVVRANTEPGNVGSVLFKVNGKKKNISNKAPHLLQPLALISLDKGDHILTAESYTKKSAKGLKASTKNAVISIINSVSVTGLNVVNKQGNTLLELYDGGVIDIKDPAFQYINITADVSAPAASVKFELNGRTFMIDNFAPYSMAGDLFGYFLRWRARTGHYTLVATPYSLPFGKGIAGQSLTIEFDVVYGQAVAAKGSGQARQGEQTRVEERSSSRIVLYPVPATDRLNIRAEGGVEGEVQLLIHDVQGKVLYSESVSAERLRNWQIDLDALGINQGVYYIHFKGSQSNVIKRFIKQ